MSKLFSFTEETERYLAIALVMFFAMVSLINASSTEPVALETFLIQNLDNNTPSATGQEVNFTIIIYKPLYSIISSADLNIKIFFLRAFGILLASFSIWLSYQIGKLIFPDLKVYPLLLPTLLSLNPDFFQYTQIAGGPVLFISTFIIYLYSLFYLTKETSYLNTMIPLVPLYLFFKMDADLAFYILLPLFIVSSLFLLYKKNESLVKPYLTWLITIALGGVFGASAIFFILENKTYLQIIYNFRRVLGLTNINRLILQNFTTYFNTTSIQLPFISLSFIILSSLTSIGLIILIFKYFSRKYSINKTLVEESEKLTFRLTLSSKNSGDPLLNSTQLFGLGLFSISYFILFIIGEARINGFFDVISLPLMIFPALGLVLMGLYGLKINGMEILFKISVASVLMLTMISRLML